MSYDICYRMTMPSDASSLRSTTQSDLAERVGVSLMTVQRALSGHPHVADQTRQRVEAAAIELGYRVNTAARTTRTGRFGTIALLLGTREGSSSLPQPLLEGIYHAAAARELNLMVVKISDDRLTDDAYVPRLLREVASDGLLIDYTHGIPQRMRDLIERTQTPAVWINSKQPHDCVHPDDYQAGRDATARLIAAGHREIAYADFTHGSAFPDPHYSAVDRLSGYLDEMADAGLLHRVIRAQDEHDIAGDRRRTLPLEILAQSHRPTAVICVGDTTAPGFLWGALRLGLEVPDDLSIILFSDAPTLTLIPVPSSMIVSHEEVGNRAVSMLIRKIAQPELTFKPISVPFFAYLGRTVAPPRHAVAGSNVSVDHH